jgi:hypothetical protein
MGVEDEVGITFQGQNRHVDGMAKDYVTYAAVAERLDIMDNAVYAPPVQLGNDILDTAPYRVGIGIIAVLLGKRAAGVRHGELELHFVEYHPGTVMLDVGIKPAGENDGTPI